MFRIPFSLARLATVIWGTVVPVASRTVTVDAASPGTIKLIQRGTISVTAALSNTFDITDVNAAKTDFRFLGCASSNDDITRTLLYLTLSSTVVTATRGTTNSGTTTASFELTEKN